LPFLLRATDGHDPTNRAETHESRTIRERSSPRARIAVIDDDLVLAELAQTLLAGEGFEVIVCSDWLDAPSFIVVERPDLVLLDLRLGDADYGWGVLDQLTLDPSTRRTLVILWSGAHEALFARAPALLPQHGIFVMTKPFEFQALLATVEEALRQYPPVLRLNGGRHFQDGGPDREPNHLTARELEVARLIARGYTNRQIAEALVLTPGTVANHVGHILDKLECSSRVQIATWTLSVGSTNEGRHQEGPSRLLA
jgi:DNA-binding NarL/FixJ family response regulator